MSKTKIFEDERLSKLPVEKQLAILGASALCLSAATEYGETVSESIARDVLELVSNVFAPLGCKAFNNLYGDAMLASVWRRSIDKEQEDT